MKRRTHHSVQIQIFQHVVVRRYTSRAASTSSPSFNVVQIIQRSANHLKLFKSFTVVQIIQSSTNHLKAVQILQRCSNHST